MSALIFNLKGTELDNAIAAFEEHIQYSFKDRSLLMEAITHPSAASESTPMPPNNQRLEFLGDAVLQIILSNALFQADHEAQEGLLTRMRSLLAKEEATADYTIKLGLDRILQLGHGECLGGGRTKPSILGDLFEAFLGALYLDAGYDTAEKLCLSLLPPLQTVKESLTLDENPKGTLQEICQARHCGNPEYRQLSKSGPVHSPVYTVGIFLNSKEIARGNGNSTRNAEKNAARAACLKLSKEKLNAPSKVIYALDFDGVICDSATETAATAWRAARTFWPDLFPEPDIPAQFTREFIAARPYLETGFQSIIMIRLIKEGHTADYFKTDFAAKLQVVMDECNVTKDTLVKSFGTARDQWITTDLDGWLALHGLYPGTIDALKTALTKHKVLILTTKQERFVSAILKQQGVDFPETSIFGLDRKISKETELAALVGAKKTNIHFVEDRIETLLRIKANPTLKRVKLHYAPWGYGTSEQLETAKADHRIDILTLESFAELLG